MMNLIKMSEIRLNADKKGISMRVSGSSEQIRELISKTWLKDRFLSEALAEICSNSINLEEDEYVPKEYFSEKTKITISKTVFGIRFKVKGDKESIKSLFWIGMKVFSNLKIAYQDFFSDVIENVIDKIEHNLICSRHKSQH